ncbi:hybrid sensor histidine kinase/response regulator [Trichlorobacter lovleyi]|uniref:histidine kinase n=1 Tax=Trichlorobacter lovleyi (strain ATCC BAA-1151 / DSM 17278 / SZ) TaxID=398767 RepID=B3E1Q6_TRIL1|nr:cache domain-containing protein [Trichlorobacter lovleyi]ACD95556.1 integral membrane sensor hybrid histidine kinase [Trichlorobacter lovleyi SZ]
MAGSYWPHSWNLLTKIVAVNLVVLFVAFLALMFYVLPLYEDKLQQQRKQYIAELVDMATGVVENCHQQELQGRQTTSEAQQSALATLRVMSRDNGYFWIHDMQLKMIMHPYATHLDNHNLAGYADPNGKKLFVEMNRLVAASGKGYLEYYWPKPGHDQAISKISFVKLFVPWGWVIGSGMYLDDISEEVSSLRHKVYLIVGLVLVLITAFSLIVAVRIKKPLQQALELLQEIPEQYRPVQSVTALDESNRLLRAMVNLVTALKAAKEQAEAASSAKGAFLAQMSHEIRTPMNAISGLTELALDQAPSAQQRELLEGISHAANHLLSLINQVLDFSKLEAGIVELEQIPFNLRQTLTATLLPFSVRVRSKGVRFETVLADNLPTRVIGDPTRLRQVLVNLVGNAVKFTRQGCIEIDVEKGEQTGNHCELRIMVRDTGIGIPQEKIAQIFAPYSQAAASTTREFGGTGLGLSIVKQLLEVMQGTITVESQPGAGTCFSVSVPVEIAGPDTLSGSADLQGVPAQRILLAEDNEINRMMLARLLEKTGHSVDVVPDGKAAVQCWKNGSYSMILMDIQMPEMDGLEATRIIRSLEAGQGGHIPIIAMTGQDSPEDVENCYRAGMDLHLKKPVQLCELVAAVARVAQ